MRVLEMTLSLAGRGVLAWPEARLSLRAPAALLAAARWLGTAAVFACVAARLYRLAASRPGPVAPGVAAALVLWLAASARASTCTHLA